jgi:hypothetical protein
VTETTDVAPWVVVGRTLRSVLRHAPIPAPPGALARWQREEARIAAQESRKEAERRERADARQELAMWSARQHTMARGLEWNQRHRSSTCRASTSGRTPCLPHRTPRPGPRNVRP